MDQIQELKEFIRSGKIINSNEIKHIIDNLSTVSTDGIRWSTRKVKTRRSLFDLRSHSICSEFFVKFKMNLEMMTVLLRRYKRGRYVTYHLVVFRNSETLKFQSTKEHKEAQAQINKILRERFFPQIEEDPREQ